MKDELKKRGYKWEPKKKVWKKCVPLENMEEEGSRVERSESSGDMLARWLDSSSLAVAGWQVSRWGRKKSSS